MNYPYSGLNTYWQNSLYPSGSSAYADLQKLLMNDYVKGYNTTTSAATANENAFNFNRLNRAEGSIIHTDASVTPDYQTFTQNIQKNVEGVLKRDTDHDAEIQAQFDELSLKRKTDAEKLKPIAQLAVKGLDAAGKGLKSGITKMVGNIKSRIADRKEAKAGADAARASVNAQMDAASNTINTTVMPEIQNNINANVKAEMAKMEADRWKTLKSGFIDINSLSDPILAASAQQGLKKGGRIKRRLKKYNLPEKVHSTRGNLSVLDDTGVVNRKTLKLK